MTKDIKALLKEAREAIKNKDYQICQKLCKVRFQINTQKAEERKII